MNESPPPPAPLNPSIMDVLCCLKLSMPGYDNLQVTLHGLCAYRATFSHHLTCRDLSPTNQPCKLCQLPQDSPILAKARQLGIPTLKEISIINYKAHHERRQRTTYIQDHVSVIEDPDALVIPVVADPRRHYMNVQLQWICWSCGETNSLSSTPWDRGGLYACGDCAYPAEAGGNFAVPDVEAACYELEDDVAQWGERVELGTAWGVEEGDVVTAGVNVVGKWRYYREVGEDMEGFQGYDTE